MHDRHRSLDAVSGWIPGGSGEKAAAVPEVLGISLRRGRPKEEERLNFKCCHHIFAKIYCFRFQEDFGRESSGSPKHEEEQEQQQDLFNAFFDRGFSGGKG